MSKECLNRGCSPAVFPEGRRNGSTPFPEAINNQNQNIMGRKPCKTVVDSAVREVYLRVPSFVALVFEEKIQVHNIRSRAAVVGWLLRNYLNRAENLPVSKAATGIFRLAVKEHSRMTAFTASVSTQVMMRGDWAAKLSRLAEADGFKTRHNLINALIAAFCTAPPRFVAQVGDELNEAEMDKVTDDGMNFHTYVSRCQHQVISRQAAAAGMTVAELIRTAVDVLFAVEIGDKVSVLPEGVAVRMKEVMMMRGTTVKRFNRDVPVRFVFSQANGRDEIFRLVQKYRIPGYPEFIRRMILFLLDSDQFTDDRVADEPEDGEDVADVFREVGSQYERVARKDFARSVYYAER